MGTSTSHRSPATTEWERVRELYQTPHPPAGEVVGRIVAALDDATRQRMADAAAVRSLEAVLVRSAQAAEQPAAIPWLEPGSGSAGLDWAAGVTALARQQVLQDRAASTLGALALEAITPTVLEALGPTTWAELTRPAVLSTYGRYAQEGELNGLYGLYLSHDLERVFRYFVARDISDYVGTPALPTVAESARLVDQVGQFCVQRGRPARLWQHEEALQSLSRLPHPQRAQQLQPLWAQAISTGLAQLAGDVA